MQIRAAKSKKIKKNFINTNLAFTFQSLEVGAKVGAETRKTPIIRGLKWSLLTYFHAPLQRI